MITVKIGGVDRTQRLAASRIALTRRIANRGALRIKVLDAGGWRPECGQYVEVDDDDRPLFRGWVWRVDERAIPGLRETEADVECVDIHQLAARRLIKAQYIGWSLPAIVNHIVTVGLSGEGVTLHGSPPQMTINGTLNFYYEPVSRALTTLADLTECIWYLDEQKRLRFGPLEEWRANWKVTEDNANVLDIRVTRSLEDYRNRQWVRSEMVQLPGEWTDTRIIPGPGHWMLSSRWAINGLINVLVDDTPKTFIGVPQEQMPPETGYDFFYFIGAGGIFTLDFVAQGGERVSFTYEPGDPFEQAEYGMKVICESAEDEIARMKALTGGSGIWEAIEDTRAAWNPDSMIALAQARLRRYAKTALRVRIETTNRNIEPGMRIEVESPLFDVDTELLVEETEWSIEWSPFGEIVRIHAELSNPEPAAASWLDYFGKLVEMARIGVGGATPGGVPVVGQIKWGGYGILFNAERPLGSRSYSKTSEPLSEDVYGVDMTRDGDAGSDRTITGVQRVIE